MKPEKNDQLTLDMYIEKWRKIGMSTEPADRPTAEWGVRWLYKTQQKLQPRIKWMTSLRALTTTVEKSESIIRISSEIFGFGPQNTVSRNAFDALGRTLNSNISSFVKLEANRGTPFGESPYFIDAFSEESIASQFSAGIIGYYDYLTSVENTNKELGFEIYGLTNLVISAGYVYAHEDVCYICERPDFMLFDEDGRLHGDGVAALSYADGFSLWVWHGNLVGEQVIKREFSWEDIQDQRNVEIRRSMIEIYGAEEFLTDADAEEIHTDGFGTLYRVDLQWDEPLVMVKVVNSTPEPDGSYKDYFLRVPPAMETAEQAVAWTFEMEMKNYSLFKES